MPFKSEAQRAWMYSHDPEMAKKWEAHTPKNKKLPKKLGVKKNTAKKGVRNVAKSKTHTISKGRNRLGN